MRYRIVADSSADLLTVNDVEFASVPLHIIVGEQDFIDDAKVDLAAMQHALDTYKGKTSTACPSPEEWINAFGEADVVFCVTITSNLSGACASANIAKKMYEEENPGKTVYVYDSLSTGPEMALLVEKLRKLILAGKPHEEIHDVVTEYKKHTYLYFSLASLNNLARNGRVNPILAKGIGLLGIRVVGRASEEGTLQPLDKSRGDKKAFQCILKHMKKHQYGGGKVIISHNCNEAGAEEMAAVIRSEFPQVELSMHGMRGLCSYYAEPQSVLVGFEAE